MKVIYEPKPGRYVVQRLRVWDSGWEPRESFLTREDAIEDADERAMHAPEGRYRVVDMEVE